MSDLDELYQSVILDHDRSPRNFRELTGEGCRSAEGYNPLCGDRVRVMVKVEDGVVADVSFQGIGCAISKASASMMTEAVRGLPVVEAEKLFETFHRDVTGTDRTEELPKRLKVLRGVSAFPMRVKCATLAWHAMKQALAEGASPSGPANTDLSTGV